MGNRQCVLCHTYKKKDGTCGKCGDEPKTRREEQIIRCMDDLESFLDANVKAPHDGIILRKVRVLMGVLKAMDTKDENKSLI